MRRGGRVRRAGSEDTGGKGESEGVGCKGEIGGRR